MGERVAADGCAVKAGEGGDLSGSIGENRPAFSFSASSDIFSGSEMTDRDETEAGREGEEREELRVDMRVAEGWATEEK